MLLNERQSRAAHSGKHKLKGITEDLSELELDNLAPSGHGSELFLIDFTLHRQSPGRGDEKRQWRKDLHVVLHDLFVLVLLSNLEIQ